MLLLFTVVKGDKVKLLKSNYNDTDLLEAYGTDYFKSEGFTNINLGKYVVAVSKQYKPKIDKSVITNLVTKGDVNIGTIQTLIDIVKTLPNEETGGTFNVEDCQYYSVLFSSYLDKLGVDNYLQGTESHVYNIFTIGGKEYELDFSTQKLNVKG